MMRFDFDPDLDMPASRWARRAAVATMLVIIFLPVILPVAVLFFNGR